MRPPTSVDNQRARAFRIVCAETGWTGARIAREFFSPKISRSAVYLVVRGEARSERIEKVLTRLFPNLIAQYPFGACSIPPHAPTVTRPHGQDKAGSSVQEGKEADLPTERPRVIRRRKASKGAGALARRQVNA